MRAASCSAPYCRRVLRGATDHGIPDLKCECAPRERLNLGPVGDKSEEIARYAALSKYGIPEDDDTDPHKRGICSEDEFDVSLVC